MRVTQRTMYNTHINNMNSTLSAYMESNIQGSSQKKINRPSDDPAGMALVLNTRNDISKSTQYEKNANSAEGWINLAQETLGNSVSTTIRSIKVLAEQAATGTLTDSEREIVASQLRELQGQLLNLSNTEYGGKSIFAGQNYDENAFEEVLGVSVEDENLENADFQVSGKSKYTQLLQFTSGGDLADTTANIEYRWSGDGGKTWETGTYTPAAAPDNTINMDGVTLTMPATGEIIPYSPAQPDAEPPVESSGTSLMVRPTAIYMGDNNDRPPNTINMGGPAGMDTDAAGTFDNDVLVRFDDDADLSVAGEVSYSYSEDNGATWIGATAINDGDINGDGSYDVRLTVPGGYVDVKTSVPPDSTIDNNTQILIQPNRADLGYEVMDNTYVSVNSVGKDFFGGVHGNPPKAIEGLEGNLFETVGELIGYCETNNQEGIQNTLDKLTTSQEEVLTETARMGALDNRISLAKDVLSFQKVNSYERLSYTEDVDLTELLTKMAQQQLAYNTVLQTSATIMQMSLTNYV